MMLCMHPILKYKMTNALWPSILSSICLALDSITVKTSRQWALVGVGNCSAQAWTKSLKLFINSLAVWRFGSGLFSVRFGLSSCFCFFVNSGRTVFPCALSHASTPTFWSIAWEKKEWRKKSPTYEAPAIYRKKGEKKKRGKWCSFLY